MQPAAGPRLLRALQGREPAREPPVGLLLRLGTAVEGAALPYPFAPLVLLWTGHDLGVNPELLQAEAYLALEMHSIGFGIALTFFAGSRLTFGSPIVRSAFLPRLLGVALGIEGLAYLANSFVVFLAPAIAGRVLAILLVTGLAEVALCLWLLERGVDVARWRAEARADTLGERSPLARRDHPSGGPRGPGTRR